MERIWSDACPGWGLLGWVDFSLGHPPSPDHHRTHADLPRRRAASALLFYGPRCCCCRCCCSGSAPRAQAETPLRRPPGSPAPAGGPPRCSTARRRRARCWRVAPCCNGLCRSGWRARLPLLALLVSLSAACCCLLGWLAARARAFRWPAAAALADLERHHGFPCAVCMVSPCGAAAPCDPVESARRGFETSSPAIDRSIKSSRVVLGLDTMGIAGRKSGGQTPGMGPARGVHP